MHYFSSAAVIAVCLFQMVAGWSVVSAPSYPSVAGAGDAAAVEERLIARPLSASDWLSLAAARLDEDKPYGTVLAALHMSFVTGPNEGSVMWQRGVFGLMQWEFLSEEDRTAIARDVAGAIADDADLAEARVVIAAKPLAVRRDIAALLRRQGATLAKFTRLGLADEAAD
ncbi:MAG TPA: hypothetical protein VFA12_13400 [Stellaceae bacterium]|nr:hypothetical protein [Stellaceae bacterium]